ncbi:MAG: hypothetical protein HQL32_03480 [Planctomycetes bacterium]|nr:hypothetical protein [Planctomycetota bacterium]
MIQKYKVPYEKIRTLFSLKKASYNLPLISAMCEGIPHYMRYREQIRKMVGVKRLTIVQVQSIYSLFDSFFGSLTKDQLARIHERFREHILGRVKGLEMTEEGIEVNANSVGLQAQNMIQDDSQIGFIFSVYKIVQEKYQFKCYCSELYQGLGDRCCEIENMIKSSEPKKISNVNVGVVDSLAQLYHDSRLVFAELEKEVDGDQMQEHINNSRDSLQKELSDLQSLWLSCYNNFQKIQDSNKLAPKIVEGLKRILEDMRKNYIDHSLLFFRMRSSPYILEDDVLRERVDLYLILCLYILDEFRQSRFAVDSPLHQLEEKLESIKSFYHFKRADFKMVERLNDIFISGPLNLPGLGDVCGWTVESITDRLQPIYVSAKVGMEKIRALTRNFIAVTLESDLMMGETEGRGERALVLWCVQGLLTKDYQETCGMYQNLLTNFAMNSRSQRGDYGGVLLPRLVLAHFQSLYYVLSVIDDSIEEYLRFIGSDNISEHFQNSKGPQGDLMYQNRGLAKKMPSLQEMVGALLGDICALFKDNLASETQIQHFDQLLLGLAKGLKLENALEIFRSEKLLLKIFELPKIKNQSWNRQGLTNTMYVMKNLL